MEISTREKTLQIVSRYVIITLSISIMTIGVYFFKFPNNFVFGGVTGGAALVAKLTPLSASAFSSCANILLLILGWIFLGRDFAISTGWATVVMTAELALFEKYVPLSGPLSNQPMLDLVFAIALPAIASALLFNVGASSGGTDVVALILKKYTHMKNTGEALFITDFVMVLAACFVFDLYTALYSFVGLTVKSLVVDAVLEQLVDAGHARRGCTDYDDLVGLLVDDGVEVVYGLLLELPDLLGEHRVIAVGGFFGLGIGCLTSGQGGRADSNGGPSDCGELAAADILQFLKHSVSPFDPSCEGMDGRPSIDLGNSMGSRIIHEQISYAYHMYTVRLT